MLGQCLLGASGGPTFPEVVGSGAAMIEGSGLADDVWCDAMVDEPYHLELRPIRDPKVPTTREAQGFLSVSQQAVNMGTCKLTPYEDDTNVYYASYDCTFPPRGEDLPELHIIGAVNFAPVPDTLK